MGSPKGGYFWKNADRKAYLSFLREQGERTGIMNELIYCFGFTEIRVSATKEHKLQFRFVLKGTGFM
jgi:hypothetical protein